MSKFSLPMAKFPQNKRQRQSLEFLIALLMGIILSLWGVDLQQAWNTGDFGHSPAIAQILRPETVAEQVYERFPDLSQENQYRNQETGEVALDNTLIARLIRYHQYVKSRPTRFRLDWQFTLADYLGANEPIKETRYPGSQTLTENPLEGDIEVIGSLNLRQRRKLVDILVSIYNPQPANSSNPKPVPANTTEPNQPPSPSKPNLSQPGDAQLLMP